MSRPREFDRDQVLDRALDVFWSQGYEGTSLSDLESATGLGRQSIYNAFGDKRALFVESLDRYAAQAREQRAEACARGAAGLRAELHGTVAFLTSSETRRGCFMARARMDQPEADDVSIRCSRNDQGVREKFMRLLSEAEADGDLRTDVDLATAARMLSTHISGLAATSLGGASPDDLRADVDLLLAGLLR